MNQYYPRYYLVQIRFAFKFKQIGLKRIIQPSKCKFFQLNNMASGVKNFHDIEKSMFFLVIIPAETGEDNFFYPLHIFGRKDKT